MRNWCRFEALVVYCNEGSGMPAETYITLFKNFLLLSLYYDFLLYLFLLGFYLRVRSFFAFIVALTVNICILKVLQVVANIYFNSYPLRAAHLRATILYYTALSPSFSLPFFYLSIRAYRQYTRSRNGVRPLRFDDYSLDNVQLPFQLHRRHH